MALCISSTYVPAKQSLELTRSAGTPLTGANVLVIGANGPTALATIDLAAMEGANVYVTADERHHVAEVHNHCGLDLRESQPQLGAFVPPDKTAETCPVSAFLSSLFFSFFSFSLVVRLSLLCFS